MADRHSEELRTFSHLAGLLAEDFPQEILARRLRVVVGDHVLDTEAGQVLVLTIARLAPRFCHRVDFACPPRSALPRLWYLLDNEEFSSTALADLGQLIWPDGEFTSEDGAAVDVDVTIGIGTAGDVSVGIDAEGAATVVTDGAVAIEQGDALFAALAAAALGCAQAAKRLYPEVLGGRVDDIVRLDLGPLGGPLDRGGSPILERPALVGVGAVGCAVVYALVLIGASGSLLLLDPDIVNDSNLMRYILFDSRHLNAEKIAAAAEIVAASGLELAVESDRAVIQEYLKEHPEERTKMELVICAVDTYDARRDIAGELPREIVNAGTTARDFTISRHGFGDGFACLACLYPPREQDIEQAAVMARELGLEKDEVSRLRKTKEPLTAELLERVAVARERPIESYANYVGEPLDSFYNKEVCATAPVVTARGEAVAPLAYGSALAGFLLTQAAVTAVNDDVRRFRMDFVTGLNSPQRSAPLPRDGCQHCGRDAYRNIYDERWR
jgi:molybdopterin/thiamine biosynthesis adenylyltransferase